MKLKIASGLLPLSATLAIALATCGALAILNEETKRSKTDHSSLLRLEGLEEVSAFAMVSHLEPEAKRIFPYNASARCFGTSGMVSRDKAFTAACINASGPKFFRKPFISGLEHLRLVKFSSSIASPSQDGKRPLEIPAPTQRTQPHPFEYWVSLPFNACRVISYFSKLSFISQLQCK